MNLCPNCSQEMLPMFTGEYCRNQCDLPIDKRTIARAKDVEERKKKENNVNNRANSSATPGSSGATPAPPATPVPTANSSDATCPKCGTTGKFISISGYRYCTASLGSGANNSCSGKWPSPVPINSITIPIGGGSNPGWFPYTGNIPYTINFGNSTIRVVSDPSVRDNHAVITKRPV